jgi:hypothetical protein
MRASNAPSLVGHRAWSLVALATLALASVALVGLGSACGASAQPRPGLRAGLPLDALVTASGLALEDLVVPTAEGAPVRVELRDAQGIAALADVRVLGSAAAARELLAALEPSLSSRGVAPLDGVGDAALADDAGTIAAFARANLLVVVRVVARDAADGARAAPDANALAARLVAACDAAPRGQPVTASPGRLVPELQPGEHASVTLPSGLVALRVVADGDGVARRTASGWELSRGAGPFSFEAWGVDALLRVVR